MAAEPNTEPTRPLPEEEQEEFEDGEESDEYDVDEEDSYEPNEGEVEEYDDEEVVEVSQHPNLTALLLGNGVHQEDDEDEDDEEDEEEEYYEEGVGTAENPIKLLPDNDNGLKPVNAGTKRTAEFDDEEGEEDEESAPKKAKV